MLLHPPPTPEQINTVRVIVRFSLRLVILLICAGLSQTSFAYAASMLLILSVTFCLVWGAVQGERVLGPSLTNWDEAAAYACIASVAIKFAQ